LLDWGFANVDAVVPVGTLVEPGVTASLSPSASPTPGASEPATSGGTSAAGTSPQGSRFQIPWLPLGAVVLVLGLVAAWWRRRSGAEPWESLPDETPASPASVLPALATTPSRPAAQRTSSVVVTSSAPRTPPPDPVVETPADPDDVTGPIPVVAATPVHELAPEPTAPSAATWAAEVPPTEVEPTQVAPRAVPPAPTTTPPEGHVRVIRPPSRPS
jgi:cytoskeletal protein RodZ